MTRETKAGVARDVWRLMFASTMARVGRASPILMDLGLTPGHMKVLFHLEDEAQPMGSLATQFGCDASTMTWLIDRLEERDLVERRSLPKDRRVKAVALTKAGRALKTRLEARMFEPPRELAALDRATLDTLRDVFTAVRDNARA